MTGKEAFEDYKQLYVAKEFKDGDCRIQKMYEEIINDKFDELTKYKRAFEIFKRFVEEGNYVDLEFGVFDGSVDISDEEIELLEELFESE